MKNSRRHIHSENSGELILRTWKRLPEAVREACHLSIQATTRAATPAWVATNWQPGNEAKQPIFIAGLFGSLAGIGQGARLFANALEGAGVDVRRIDVGPALGERGSLPVKSASAAGSGLLISFLNPPELVRWLGGGGALALRQKRHIGFWFWELPQAPPAWRWAFQYVDEVWCQSLFTAGSLSSLAPARVAVRTSPHPIFATPRPAGDRARFGLNDGTCAVLASVDLRSTSARKNPLGAIQAFIRAVPRPEPKRAVLICKIRGGNIEPDVMKIIEQTAESRSDLMLFRQELSAEAMLQLVASVDIALTLHRSEGFGLLAAEAAWLGKPVVTTGWSGVMDFLNSESAALVKWSLVPVVDSQGIYAGGTWAEPDLDDAANILRDLIGSRDLRNRLGWKAQKHAEAIFGRTDWLKATFSKLGLSEDASHVAPS